ncbi:MAG: hypothetical protein B7X90_01945 [Novosphingobium sp. 17-62-19]|uniref:hypothetical protein n=1 Tax=Novosphingobium sp. 17-62-19 TaxID=1970406 RepID=UPI000BCC6069|nr:hypothetical protein [Novosphingobium sp. 17-62-19]OZA21400.1 MAG: hypothetical protein B7X90_01945 [Novosphingobium sp. 17-62-19]HQS95052.1 hypothetical protein [Novosphingobium sp.]
MTDQPITVVSPTIAQLHAGKVTRLRRPQGRLSTLKPGDRLWLREQFFLASAFEQISPTQALDRGATPVFGADHADLPDYATADLGRRRFAREMPKRWHRAHLVVTHVALERLQQISTEEIAAEGFASAEQFAASWNENLSLAKNSAGGGITAFRRLEWKADPAVIAFTFAFVPHPLPEFSTSERSLAS